MGYVPIYQRLDEIIADYRARCGDEACWEWKRSVVNGYGGIYVPYLLPRAGMSGNRRAAHLVVYEHLFGRVDEGLELDHLCRNRPCMNPFHVEPVTHVENVRRSPIASAAVNGRRTHCTHGHPLSGDNLRHWRGKRVCKACATERMRAHRGARSESRTHCIHGHPLSGDNLRMTRNGKYSKRTCKQCVRGRLRAARAKAKAA